MYPVVKPGARIRYEDYSGETFHGVAVSFVNDKNEVLQSKENDPHYGSGDEPMYHYINILFDDGSRAAVDYIWCEVLTSALNLWGEHRG